MRGLISKRYYGLAFAITVSIGVSLVLFIYRAAQAGNTRYWFLLWNLALALIPLLVAMILLSRIRRTSWRRPLNLTLTFIWVTFLPNSFYLVTDLIHLQNTGEVSLLYDAVFFSSVIFNGMALGFLSVFLVHKALMTRMSNLRAHAVIAGVLLACSYAIYIGRYFRWSSWDIVANPAGVLFEISDQFINPDLQLTMLMTTGIVFLLLSSVYLVVWQAGKLIRSN